MGNRVPNQVFPALPGVSAVRRKTPASRRSVTVKFTAPPEKRVPMGTSKASPSAPVKRPSRTAEEAGARTRLRSAAFLSRSAPAAVSGQARSSMVSSSVYSTASSAQAGASAS